MYLFNLKIFVCLNSTLGSSCLGHVSHLAMQSSQVKSSQLSELRLLIKRLKDFQLVAKEHNVNTYILKASIVVCA